MPGLIRGVARTAVDRRYGHRRVQPGLPPPGRHAGRRRSSSSTQQQQPQQQQPVYAAPPPRRRPRPSMDDKLAQLKELGELKEQGVLTDSEFEAQKARILNS